MTSPVHAVIVDLLEAHPEALTYLLELEGLILPGPLIAVPGTRSRVITLERRVDRAFLVGSRDAPLGFLLAEVQSAPDDDKLFSWPLYVELARTRYRCEGSLVALTVNEPTRRWIDGSIVPVTGQHGTTRQLRPTVLALDAIDPPLLLRPDRPYLARLAVAAHAAARDQAAVAREAVRITVDQLQPRLASEQLDAILGMVDAALRMELEQSVMEHPRYKSEFFRRIWDAGYSEGAAKATAEVTAKIMAKGEARGEARGKAESVLAVLDARGVPVSDAMRARILECRDLATLDLWIQRAAVLSTAAAVVRAPRAHAAGSRTPRRRTGR